MECVQDEPGVTFCEATAYGKRASQAMKEGNRFASERAVATNPVMTRQDQGVSLSERTSLKDLQLKAG